MSHPTVSHSTAPPVPARAQLSGLTPKGRLAAALIRLKHLVDQLTEAEQASLAAALAPIVRCARSRVALRIVQVA